MLTLFRRGAALPPDLSGRHATKTEGAATFAATAMSFVMGVCCLSHSVEVVEGFSAMLPDLKTLNHTGFIGVLVGRAGFWVG